MTSKWYKLKLDWTVHVIDLVVVIIGVTIAFAITNYAEKRKGQHEKTVILKAMLNEIERDIEIYTGHQIPKNQRHVRDIEALLSLLKDPERNNDSTSTYFTKAIFPFSNWMITRTTFQSIRASGKIDLIENQELKNELVKLYTARELQSSFIIQEGLKIHKELNDYLLDHITIDDPDTYLNVIDNRRFYNYVVMWRDITSSKIHEFNLNVELLERVKSMIQEEIN